jgi:hypothetical protein
MAANTKGIRAGKAFVEIFADDSRLMRGLNAARQKLSAFGAGVRASGLKMMGAGAAIAAPMVAAAKSAADSGAAIYEMSKRTGMSVPNLSALAYASEMTGASLDNVEVSVKKMQKALFEAAQGGEKAQEAFSLLGLSVDDLAKLNPDEQFALIAKRLSDIKDPAIKSGIALELFGKSGTELIPMMENLQSLSGDAAKLGLIKTDASAKEAKEFSDVLKILGLVVKSVVNSIGTALMPVLKQFATRIIDGVLTVRNFIREHQQLVVTVFQVAAAIMGVGAGLLAVSYIFTGLSKAVGVLSTIFGVVQSVITGIVAVIGAMLTPIGLVVTAIVGLGAYFLYASGAAGKAVDWLGGVFASVAEDATASFGAISNALAGGDIVAAAKVLWAQLKMWWEQGTSGISDTWNGALLWMKQVFFEAVGGWRIIFEEMGHGLTVAWIETTSFLSQTWTKFTTALMEAWNWVATGLEKAWNRIKGVFVKGFDADTANKAAEEAYQSKIKELENNKNAALAERERKRQGERDAESAENDANLNKIIDETEAWKKSAQDERDAKKAQNQADIDAAKKELDDARSKANAVKPRKGVGQLSMDDYLKNAKGLMGDLDDLNGLSKQTTRGTFNANALAGLAGGPIDKVVTNTANTVEQLKKLNETLPNLGDNMAFV